MKRFSIIIFSLLISAAAFSQSFDKANMRVGGGFCYATDIDNLGLTFTGAYEITPLWEASVAFTHFFEKNYVSWNVLDFDGHYIFYNNNDNVNVYGLAGLTVMFAKATIPEVSVGGVVYQEETIVKDSQGGVNIGVGMNYSLTEQLNLAPEFRISLMDGSYVRIGATLQYMF